MDKHEKATAQKKIRNSRCGIKIKGRKIKS